MKLSPGSPYPLGASFDGSGTNFSVFSEIAQRVVLCLFDSTGHETQLDLPEATSFCWHGYLPDCQPGQRYGFRVHGPFNPGAGHRCHPSKLLLDPYAKAIHGDVDWNEALFPYYFDRGSGETNTLDSAPFNAKSVVISPFFHWGDDRPPRTPLHETVIYEMHVAGFSALNPELPEALRGTYAGLSHPTSIRYLKTLGVTAVELMPVHHFAHDSHLLQRGLRNYWGYNTVGFFAPHQGYAAGAQAGQQVQEFKQMVKELHDAGIEVILDVVYNHTAEGNHMGPVLCMKGLDNAAYYRLVASDRRYYMDYTGTGNTLNVQHPQVLQLIMDSLRYWVTEMHVDGFRFDLASALARELHAVDRLSSFFDLIHQDPVISRVKLIAEPWDVGEGGYQVGNFPHNWSEWNGKYRDCVRDFWKGDPVLSEFAYRFTGSSDLYGNNGRRPFASINFVTAHDGFTLHDLVSYNDKHNDSNGEGNRDGDSHNRSWNCGTEGITDDPVILQLRGRQKRNFLATLLLSQGIPMLLSGDEMGRTQSGNNNAYCQDSALSWCDWMCADLELLDFSRSLIELRKAHPVFRRRKFFRGRNIEQSDTQDIAWYRPDAVEMSAADWTNGYAKAVAVFLNGSGLNEVDKRGEPIVDDSFMILINAHHEDIRFALSGAVAARWVTVLDTDEGTPARLKLIQGGRELLPESETQRLQRLYAYRILDTAPESAFDDLTALAAELCGTSVACISLVDETRQWFKSHIGLECEQTAREVAFCSHAIRNVDEVMEVPDAALDARFAGNPLVTGDPNIRFYAGAPLVTPDGFALGTLCVIDSQPRKLSERQKSALRRLSRQAMAQLELRRQMQGADAGGGLHDELEHLVRATEVGGRLLASEEGMAVKARSLVVLRALK